MQSFWVATLSPGNGKRHDFPSTLRTTKAFLRSSWILISQLHILRAAGKPGFRRRCLSLRSFRRGGRHMSGTRSSSDLVDHDDTRPSLLIESILNRWRRKLLVSQPFQDKRLRCRGSAPFFPGGEKDRHHGPYGLARLGHCRLCSSGPAIFDCACRFLSGPWLIAKATGILRRSDPCTGPLGGAHQVQRFHCLRSLWHCLH